MFLLVGLKIKNLKMEKSSFNAYLVSTTHMFCSVLGTGNTTKNKIDTNPCHLGASIVY